MSVANFPEPLILDFETEEQCEEFKRAAASMGMGEFEFLLWLVSRERNADNQNHRRSNHKLRSLRLVG